MSRQPLPLVVVLMLVLFSIACSSERTDTPFAPGDGDAPDGDLDRVDREPDDDGEASDGDRDPDMEADGEAEREADMEPPPAEVLHVMSFNVRTGSAPDGPDAWANRKTLVTRLIEREQPAVLGVQEAWKFQLEYIEEQVPGYAWVGISRADTDGVDEYCAVFYRTERFTLLNSGTFWLSDTPNVPLSTFNEEQIYPRIVTWVELQSLADSRTFLVFNTHFDHGNAAEVPERSAAVLLAQADVIAADKPLIVMGDFNEYVGSDAYRILTGEMSYNGQSGDLIDPWAVLDIPEEGSFHGFSGESSAPSRIDWILASDDFIPEASALLHDHEGERYPSDHFPITATFSWPAPLVREVPGR